MSSPVTFQTFKTTEPKPTPASRPEALQEVTMYGNPFLKKYNEFARLPATDQRTYFEKRAVKQNVTRALGEEALQEVQSIVQKIFSPQPPLLTRDEIIMLGMSFKASQIGFFG